MLCSNVSVWWCCRRKSAAEQAVSAEGDVGLHTTGGVCAAGVGHIHHQRDAARTDECPLCCVCHSVLVMSVLFCSLTVLDSKRLAYVADAQDPPHLHHGLPQPSHPASHHHSSASLFCYATSLQTDYQNQLCQPCFSLLRSCCLEFTNC